jgi:hypothetical protein
MRAAGNFATNLIFRITFIFVHPNVSRMLEQIIEIPQNQKEIPSGKVEEQKGYSNSVFIGTETGGTRMHHSA